MTATPIDPDPSRWERSRFGWVTRTISHPIYGTGVETRRSLVRWLIAGSKP